MNVLRAVRRIPVAYPFAFGAVFAGMKNGLADVLVQTQVEDAERIDWRRTQVFSTFGLLFCGCWQFVLFTKIMPRLCPGAAKFAAKPLREKLKDRRGLRELAIQVGIENGINNPLLFYPAFYAIKIGLETEDYSPASTLPKGIARYKQTWQEDVVAIWKVWVPAQILNFAFMPMWMRVPYTTVVSFGWTCYVSLVRGKPETDADAVVAEELVMAGEAAAVIHPKSNAHEAVATPVAAAVAPTTAPAAAGGVGATDANGGDQAEATCAPPPTPRVYMASASWCGFSRKAIAAHERDGIGADEISVLQCDGDDKSHALCRATRGFPTYYTVDAEGAHVVCRGDVAWPNRAPDPVAMSRWVQNTVRFVQRSADGRHFVQDTAAQ